MIRKVLCSVWAGICLCVFMGAGPAMFTQGPVAGYVEVPPGAVPTECYELRRGGQEPSVKPLSHDMPVRNGDEILPLPGKTVTLAYIYNRCGRQKIQTKTIVDCKAPPPESQKEVWTLSAIFKKFKELLTPVPLDKVIVITKKGSDPKYPCFPAVYDLRLSPWPVSGTTLLAENQPTIYFRWFEPGISPCAKVQLVIVPCGKNAPRIFESEMEAGELKKVNVALNPGQSYEWFVEKTDGPSERYGFRVLKKGESENIGIQLDKIEKLYAAQSPLLHQALYLQLISDAGNGLDLYADSLRILAQYSKREKTAIPDKFFKRFQDHCWPE